MTITTRMLDTLNSGDTITCRHHTGIPDREGLTLTIEQVRPTFIEATHPIHGAGYRIAKPTRRRDIIADTDMRTGYWIDRPKGTRWAYIEYARH